MLGYVFWHRPAKDADPGSYERAQLGLHRSLAARPPAGFRGSVLYRPEALSWLEGAGGPVYEDWYLVDDWAALGVLRQAAVSRGHRGAHDAAAHHVGPCAGGVYRLCEGEPRPAEARLAVWVTAARGVEEAEVLPLMLGDGLDHDHSGLWRRELVLGPAPEYCLLTSTVPAGVREGRLPEGWRAQRSPRSVLWSRSLIA